LWNDFDHLITLVTEVYGILVLLYCTVINVLYSYSIHKDWKEIHAFRVIYQQHCVRKNDKKPISNTALIISREQTTDKTGYKDAVVKTVARQAAQENDLTN